MEETDQMQDEETTSTESSPENKQEDTQSSEGDRNTRDAEESIPLKRWNEREHDWNRRLEERDRQWESKFNDLRKEIPARQENKDIPEWFGGDAKQWQSFQADQRRALEEVETRTVERVTSQRTVQEKALQDANQWFTDSMQSIETEAGEAVDQNAILAIARRDELIDSKGRWNYKAAFKILRSEQNADSTTDAKLADRKKLAGATLDKGGKGGEREQRTFKTREDFQRDRPW